MAEKNYHKISEEKSEGKQPLSIVKLLNIVKINLVAVKMRKKNICLWGAMTVKCVENHKTHKSRHPNHSQHTFAKQKIHEIKKYIYFKQRAEKEKLLQELYIKKMKTKKLTKK